MNAETGPDRDRWTARAKVAFVVFAGIAAVLFLAEHRAHVVPYLPWLLLAACPLMHLFMHGGHGGHRRGGGSDAADDHRHEGEHG